MLQERVSKPRHPHRFWMLAAGVVLIAGGCGSVSNRPSPSPPGPSATPAQTFQVLVTQNPRTASAAIDLYDSAAGSFRTIPTNGSPALARFAGAGRVSFLTQEGLVSENVDGSERRIEVSGGMIDYAWSKDGALAYITSVGALNDRYQLTVRLANGQVSTADVGISTGIGGIVPQRTMQFSPDGQTLLIAEPMISNPYVQVRALDASLQFAPSVGPFVSGGGAAWTSGGKLALSNAGSLQITDPATHDVQTILSGVHAWNPTTSPDGRYIVYEQRDPAPPEQNFGGYGPVRLEAFDTTVGKVVDGFRRDGGALPWFVGPTRFWFAAGSDSGPTIHSYNLTALAESSVGVSGVITDVRSELNGS